MLKWLIFIFFIFYQIDSHTQSLSDVGFEAKKKYTLQRNNKDAAKSKDYIILKEDTLVNTKDFLKINDIERFCDCFKDESFVYTVSSAIQFELPEGKIIAETKQWNSHIYVFIDNSIPRNIRKEFRSFFTQTNNIDNFNLSFTNTIKKSNYLVKVSDSIISNYKTKKKTYDEENPYSKVTYNLVTDNNNKFYSGILLIDKSVLANESLMLKKLKQMFFMSLGPFSNSKSMPEESLLSPNYLESKKISSFDLKLLKTHYYRIYPRPLNKLDLIKLSRMAKSICKK